MFNLEKSVMLWRRSMEHNGVILREDLDELEQHVRDQVAWLTRRGWGPEAAFARAIQEMGDYGSTEGEYGKVFWGKVRRHNQLYTELLGRLAMVSSYLKVAFRNLVRYKGFTAINVGGLAVSMSLCLFILLFVQDQRRYDRFHEKADRIYRVNTVFAHGSRVATSPYTLSPVLATEAPGIETALRLKRFGGAVSSKETSVAVRGLYAEAPFFDVFSFTLASGDPARALADPNTIVLSEESAAKLFPGRDAVGQVLTLAGQGDFRVTGVLAPMPAQTNLKFEALVSFATLGLDRQQVDWGYSSYEYYNYVLLKEEANPQTVARQFPEIIQRHYGAHPDLKLAALQLQPITGIRLGPFLGNQHSPAPPPVILYALVVIALVVMSIACFNYVGLSIARSLKRAKEVGVRKVMGAQRAQLVGQFVGEALIVSVGACAGAVGLLFLLVPSFNGLWAVQYMGGGITVHFVRDLPVLLSFFSFSVLVGLAAGVYPALYLSSFRPVNVLKGVLASRPLSRMGMRKILVVTQFAISLLFIITTLLLHRQAQVMLAADYGFNTSQVVNIPLQGVPYEPLRQALLRNPQVTRVSASSLLPGTSDTHDEAIWTGAASEGAPKATAYSVDYDFVDNMAFELVAGRSFSRDFAGDTSEAVILNETAVRALGFATPSDVLGETVYAGFAHRPEDATRYAVVGVVKDVHYTRLEAPIGPMLLYSKPERLGFANVRLASGDTEESLAALARTWKQVEPSRPFSYQFYDDRLVEEYAIYADAVGVLGVACGFAVVIACLGLLGMAAYATETRRKEIGVRKVMGAGVPDLVVLLSKEFLTLIVAAVLIGGPLAWVLNNLWLEKFATRVEFDAWIFIPAILMLVLLAFVTVASQTVRAASSNPVETLRYD